MLVERGLAETRSRAQGLILSGSVRVGDRVVTKTGLRVAPDEPLGPRLVHARIGRQAERQTPEEDRGQRGNPAGAGERVEDPGLQI